MAGETILHVGYDSMLIEIREGVLRRAGYHILSVKGSDEAKRVSAEVEADLIIIGNGGRPDERGEIVDWLARKLPGIPILVMRVSNEETYPGATVEFIGNTPSQWLQTIEKTLASQG